MELVSEKFGGHPHYRGVAHVLGQDAHGTWVWGPNGRTIYRGDAVVGTADHHTLAVVAPDAWWTALWFVGHPEIELYVNINTPADVRDDRIVSVDLDLDVIRWVDGRVEVVDRDEFEVHQVRYGYPADLIAAAERATAAAYELVTAGAPPFDGVAAAHWIEHGLALAEGADPH